MPVKMPRPTEKQRHPLEGRYVVMATGCWEWTAATSSKGYGQVRFKGRQVGAHCCAWLLEHGSIPAGAHVHHRCENRRCVNPSHLELANARDHLRLHNSISQVNAAKTHCKRGHPFDEENTYIVRGGRECRECKRMHERNRRAREAA